MESTPKSQVQTYDLAEPIRLPSPAARLRWITIGCVIFFILGVVIFFNAEDLWEQAIALLCIVLTGIVGGVVMPPLLKGGDIAVFDSEGFYTRRYEVKILWSDIRAVAVMQSGDYESLCVVVKEYEKYRPRIPWQAAWMRTFYRSIWGRFCTVSLMSVLDPVTSKELTETLGQAEDFDFFWSHHEFPGMSIHEVKEILETQTHFSTPNAEKQLPEGIKMVNEPQEQKNKPSESRTAQPVSPGNTTDIKVLFTIPGFVKHAEAGDSGGAMWYEKAVVELCENQLRIIELKDGHAVKTEVLLLNDIAEMKMQPCPKEGEYGSLKFKQQKKNFWDYLLKLFPLEVNFDLSQQDQFVQLTEKIRQLKANRGGSASVAYTAPESQPQATLHHTATPTHQSSTPSLSDLEVLDKLADMRTKGIISEAEFNAKKKQILGL